MLLELFFCPNNLHTNRCNQIWNNSSSTSKTVRCCFNSRNFRRMTLNIFEGNKKYNSKMVFKIWSIRSSFCSLYIRVLLLLVFASIARSQLCFLRGSINKPHLQHGTTTPALFIKIKVLKVPLWCATALCNWWFCESFDVKQWSSCLRVCLHFQQFHL